MPLKLTLAKAKALGIKLPPAAQATRKRKPRPGQSAMSPPQQRLWDVLSHRFPGAVSEYRPIKGRRYSLDICWPDLRFAVEVDGFQHHRFLSDFHRDRAKRNLLALDGWVLLAIPARDVWRDLEGVCAMVDRGLETRRRQQQGAAVATADSDGVSQPCQKRPP